MDFAVIAAGEGSRLKKDGISYSKPMVKLQGISLLERLIAIFLNNNAERIIIATNEHSPDVDAFLQDLQLPVPLSVVRKDTPSSLHSFHALLPFVKSDKLCLTTVDTVFQEEIFHQYIKAFEEESSLDGLMAVTAFIDDESPLYVKADESNRIQGFLDRAEDGVFYVSGGVYCFRHSVFPVVQQAVEKGTQRMRNFQRMLIEEGLNLKVYPFSKIIDIDHAHDLAMAEDWLQQQG